MYVYAHMYAYVACSSSVFRIRKTALFLLLQPSLNVRITSQMQQYYITSLPKLFSECTAMNSGCLPFERVKCLNEKKVQWKLSAHHQNLFHFRVHALLSTTKLSKKHTKSSIEILLKALDKSSRIPLLFFLRPFSTDLMLMF